MDYAITLNSIGITSVSERSYITGVYAVLSCLRMNYFVFTLTISTWLTTVWSDSSCKTPENKNGMCVRLCDCPNVLSALSTWNNSSIEYLTKVKCGASAGHPLVCCASTVTEESNLELSEPKENLIPRRVCGFQHSDDYQWNGSSTALSEFPWIAKISNLIDTGCIGSLISRKYVLTTAYCTIHSDLFPLKVRLGEFHTTNATDCILESEFDQECSDPVEDFGVEKVVEHPDYSEFHLRNDIALLRLNRSVIYTDYIRPICLPAPGVMPVTIGGTLLTSGWGVENRGYIRYKKKHFHELISNAECVKTWGRKKVFDYHLCTRQYNSSTSFTCLFDVGGPLMHRIGRRWYQEGIISLAPECTNQSNVVHIKLTDYVDWIEHNIEP